MDDIWKELRKVIDIETKAFAEKQAINTAKQLNEVYEATRKEMKNETLIDKLNAFAKGQLPFSYPAVCREAIAEIERLEAEVKANEH
jgi:hypothetical protein